MSAGAPQPGPRPKEEASVFKWLCLLVAVIALAVYGWILNDVRRDVKGLAERADRQLTQTEQVTGQLERHLPRILAQAEQAATAVNAQLPALLARSEDAVDNLAELSDRFQDYQGLMGAVHAGKKDNDLFAYGASLLKLIGDQKSATVGVKKPGPSQELRRARPAGDWAKRARGDARFLSLAASSKAEVLHGLARTASAAPLYIQLEKQAPRLLGDWLQEAEAGGLK
jgi:hypothetical protein